MTEQLDFNSADDGFGAGKEKEQAALAINDVQQYVADYETACNSLKSEYGEMAEYYAFLLISPDEALSLDGSTIAALSRRLLFRLHPDKWNHAGINKSEHMQIKQQLTRITQNIIRAKSMLQNDALREAYAAQIRRVLRNSNAVNRSKAQPAASGQTETGDVSQSYDDHAARMMRESKEYEQGLQRMKRIGELSRVINRVVNAALSHAHTLLSNQFIDLDNYDKIFTFLKECITSIELLYDSPSTEITLQLTQRSAHIVKDFQTLFVINTLQGIQVDSIENGFVVRLSA